LRKTADFKRVFSRGKSAATPLFVLYVAQNDVGQNRLGLSVGKKTGCAVIRNRVKRHVREFFRTELSGIEFFGTPSTAPPSQSVRKPPLCIPGSSENAPEPAFPASGAKRGFRTLCPIEVCPANFDFVVIARAPAGQLPRAKAFAKVGESLTYLLKRLSGSLKGGSK